MKRGEQKRRKEEGDIMARSPIVSLKRKIDQLVSKESVTRTKYPLVYAIGSLLELTRKEIKSCSKYKMRHQWLYEVLDLYLRKKFGKNYKKNMDMKWTEHEDLVKWLQEIITLNSEILEPSSDTSDDDNGNDNDDDDDV